MAQLCGFQLAQTVPKVQQNKKLQEAVASHVDSFNFMIEHTLPQIPAGVPEREVMVNGTRVRWWLEAVNMSIPTVGRRGLGALSHDLYPAECRERRCTYKADLQVGDDEAWTLDRVVGQVPVMVKSTRCHLAGLSPSQLLLRGEEREEMGGYFIVNGNEKLMRILIMNRRNHILGVVRPSFTKRGRFYSEYGTTIRCVRNDQSSQSVNVHYKLDGTCTVGFTYRKAQYLIPAVIILRALVECNDRQIFNAVVQGDSSNTFLVERMELILAEHAGLHLYSSTECLKYLGNRFKVALDLPERYTDEEVGLTLLERIICVHIPASDRQAKFNLLVLMIQKLYSLVSGQCAADNPDSPMHQELLLPGVLYGAVLKEQLDEYLSAARKQVQRDLRLGKVEASFNDQAYFRKVLAQCPDPCKKLDYLLATGNLTSPSGLDLLQVSGFTIVADKLNFFRYLSHFRCVHRGAFFAQMKTTAVRKLLPEAWGFVCPVHTPDGAPCGLLNHLSRSCIALNQVVDTSALPAILSGLGVLPLALSAAPGFVSVLLDGQVMGRVHHAAVLSVANQLRMLKVSTTDNGVSQWLEIGYVPVATKGQYPGLFLFSTPARMMRPVTNLRCNTREMIGSFEQVYMDIAVGADEFIPGVTTHLEENKSNFLSVIASLTPFSDFNQSPRNMYQCQMGKQTMGFPLHSFPRRADNKLYCLRNPQTPMIRNAVYDEYGMDEYPLGANAVVAVIAYTGYDMEDAMIINKSSKERGFANAHLVTTKIVSLEEDKRSHARLTKHFGAFPQDRAVLEGHIDVDGFPFVGSPLPDGAPFYSYIDELTNTSVVARYKGEPAIVLQVTLLASGEAADGPCHSATIKLAINRNPIIGDKFASRHGQKGVMSHLWPAEDMPFSESGMSPDILFNPHGFPSRMTIAALNGIYMDSSPFKFSETTTNATDYFGEQLVRAGYSRQGHERLYSGQTGLEFDVEIFMGVVYYQRLRHMVSDKYQVRTTGPVHTLTHQPIKGRKRAGGIRFGEMERDSLLSHGSAFLLQDRLFHCSDACEALICKKCGCLFSPILERTGVGLGASRKVLCRLCNTTKHVVTIAVPYVFRYLAAELLSMNIDVRLTVV